MMGKLSTHEFAHGGPSFDSALAAGAQPLGPFALGRRVVERLGRCRGGGLRAGRDGLGHRRLGARARGTQRRRRPQADLRADQPPRRHQQFIQLRPLRPACVDSRGLRAHAPGGGGLRPRGSGQRRAPGAGLLRRVRTRPQRLAHRCRAPFLGGRSCRPARKSERRWTPRSTCSATLGATLEDVRLRSLQEYFDVKIIVAESEIHSVHQRDLQERPGDFGADFMGKILLASLFSASDYVQAQRTRRHMLEEMEPIYARYDVLVTAGMSPAPRFSDVRIIDFWEKPNMTTPFSVTAGPALSLCNGYTKDGLPMSMQVVGRPFDEIKTLRAGYAYERATAWRAAPAEPGAGGGQGAGGPVDGQSDRSLALRRKDAPARRFPARPPRTRKGVGRAHRPAVRGGALWTRDGGAGAPRPAAGGRAGLQFPLSAVYRIALNLSIVRCTGASRDCTVLVRPKVMTAKREYPCTGRERERRSRDA